jgi:ABC-2 type transport system permease protein
MIGLIWWKEVRAVLYTWKSVLWLLIASLGLSFTSYVLLTDKELSLLDQTELLWLLSKIILGIAFLIVTIDASAIITSEFEHETAESLFLSPLKLRDIIVGKLLAELTLWAALLVVAIPYIVVTSAGTRLAPAFAGYVGLLGTLGVAALVMVVFGISLLFRSSRNTLTTSLVILLALAVPALFSSTLKISSAGQWFSRINPLDNIFSALDNVLVDYQLSLGQNAKYLLPVIVFTLLALGFMILAARSFKKQGVVRSE